MSEPSRPGQKTNHDRLDRRHFLKTTGVGAAAAVVAGSLGDLVIAKEKSKKVQSETLVSQLFGTLTEEQKKLCTFDFNHPLQKRVDNNWYITKARVGKSFNKDQQDLIRQIFLKLHSAKYAKQVMKQVEHDSKRNGGFADCSIALFGQPGSGKFEFVLAGRHVTRRCDGDSVDGAAFGGPIFYGHAAKGFDEPADHAGNIYWYQAKRANELFQALDGKQRKVALRDDPREEDGNNTVQFQAKQSDRHGLPASDMSTDQRELLQHVLSDVLAPFRKKDRAESLKLVKAAGIENLQISYYNNKGSDIGGDGVWDVWQIEGPNAILYFRGAPHVHAWINIVANPSA